MELSPAPKSGKRTPGKTPRPARRPACGSLRPGCLELVLFKVPGIFLVNKSPGPTSFDVIRAARRELRIRKIGHAGSLDPVAGGLLVLGAGGATKLLPLFLEADKTYHMRVRLGVRTDTFDLTGEVLEERDASGVTEEAVLKALGELRGKRLQRPPPYSAVKVGGKPAYKLARKGVKLELQPRPVEISRLELVGFEPPEVELEMDCSKGTYARALAEELGQMLGTGGVLSYLVRTRVGPFRLDEARPLGKLMRG